MDKNGAVRPIERKNIDVLVLSWFDPSEMKDIMALPEYRKMVLLADVTFILYT